MDISSRISSRFDRFHARIRPTREQHKNASRQVDYLKEHLTERIEANNHFHLERIFRSGSTAKHTDLAPTGTGTFDIDLGAYFRSQGHTPKELNVLLSYIRERLREIYPRKPEEDFHQGHNAVNVIFRDSGLKVDVVPIARDNTLKLRNSGWIPREDGWRLTSITAHTHFIYKCIACTKLVGVPVKFNKLVRLVKWWNRGLPDNLKQCSYFCELITAAALERRKVTDRWQSSLDLVFTFLSQHAFSQPIIFNDYYDATTVKCPDDLVVVLDAVNKENNVTRKWNKAIKRDYLNKLNETHEWIKQALNKERAGREDDAIEIWGQIFGNDFQRLSQ